MGRMVKLQTRTNQKKKKKKNNIRAIDPEVALDSGKNRKNSGGRYDFIGCGEESRVNHRGGSHSFS